MTASPRGSALDVLVRFLRLGLTSFGGPIAHLGYFRAAFVHELEWLDDAAFAEIVAVCSALPGPTSSQVGIVLGARRAGAAGALAAWLGFTTPSAVAMAALGIGVRASASALAPLGAAAPLLAGAFAGLIAAAGGVVAQAVVALATSLARTRATQAIALGSFVVSLFVYREAAQFAWLPLALGALAGLALPHARALPAGAIGVHVPHWVAVAAACTLAALLFALPLVAPPHSALALFSTFVRAGALVFGGGHVILPLLQGLIAADVVPKSTFLAGYGAAQAVPGPLSTFATFLGAVNATPAHGVAGALLATVAIFLPSFLLLAAVLPAWNALRSVPRANAVLAGVNAAVVGLVAAVLVDPIGRTIVAVPWHAAIALAAFLALTLLRQAPWLVVAACATAGAAITALAR
jgi:chromate transporter